jgi:5-formyltetrahydrofolate cyclo-ligase
MVLELELQQLLLLKVKRKDVTINEKQKIREKFLKERESLSEVLVTENSAKIWERLSSLREFLEAKTIMFYVAKGNEVRTENMIKESICMGKKVAVPVMMKENTLSPSLLTDYDRELVPKHFGILEPKKECLRLTPPEEIEIIIVPGVVFDRQGGRIGFGKGFYDNFLKRVSAKACTIGIAYQSQIVDKLPVKETDIPIDIIITENEVIRLALYHKFSK